MSQDNIRAHPDLREAIAIVETMEGSVDSLLSESWVMSWSGWDESRQRLDNIDDAKARKTEIYVWTQQFAAFVLEQVLLNVDSDADRSKTIEASGFTVWERNSYKYGTSLLDAARGRLRS